MEIFIERENKTSPFELEKDTEIREILKKLDITPESIIIVKNGEIALEEEKVNNTDKLKLLSVVSGG